MFPPKKAPGKMPSMEAAGSILSAKAKKPNPFIAKKGAGKAPMGKAPMVKDSDSDYV